MMRQPNGIVGWLLTGAGAGVCGGAVFGAAMIALGYLPTVAGVVRASSEPVGFAVHMVIAAVIGAGFGALIWRQRPDAGETMLWGLAYGMLWWFLGPLTLLPLLLGHAPDWSVAVAGSLTASLVGHLAYGAGLGIVFHRMEARFSPWWIPRAMADEARLAARKAQLLSAAPAVWALVVAVALTLPVLLASGG